MSYKLNPEDVNMLLSYNTNNINIVVDSVDFNDVMHNIVIIIANSNSVFITVCKSDIAGLPFIHFILLSSGLHCLSSVHVNTGLVGTNPEESFALQLKLTFIPIEM
jgi:hypothetical protein